MAGVASITATELHEKLPWPSPKPSVCKPEAFLALVCCDVHSGTWGELGPGLVSELAWALSLQGPRHCCKINWIHEPAVVFQNVRRRMSWEA